MTWNALWGTQQDYLDENPKELKWINKCSGCGGEGYKPELPAESRFNAIRQRFSCLSLDELGFCVYCKK